MHSALGLIVENSDAFRKVQEAGYTLDELFNNRHKLFSNQELSEIFREYVNGNETDEERERAHWQWGLAEKFIEKEQGRCRAILNNQSKENPDSENLWRKSMIKKRMVEFWTGNPNDPIPAREERIKILAQRKISVPLFARRLGAYNIPPDFTDEQILNWD